MPMIEVGQISVLLSSNKIKERNDGISQLEELSNMNLNMNSSQFDTLIQGIFSLLDMEVPSYIKTRNRTIELRISRSTSSLRRIVLSILSRYSRTDGGDKVSIKYKSFFNFLSLIRSHFFILNDVLLPFLIDFAKIISALFNIRSLREHLGRKEWEENFCFFCRSIDELIYISGKSQVSFDSIITELLISLDQITRVEDSLESSLECVSYLLNFLEDKEERCYATFFETIKSVASYTKSAGLQLRIWFKMASSLAVSLSTEDMNILQELVSLGIRNAIRFLTTHATNLNSEVYKFFDLDAVHICLTSYNRSLEPSSSEWPDISDIDHGGRSFENKTFSGNSIQAEVYNIGRLIQNFLILLHDRAPFTEDDASLTRMFLSQHALEIGIKLRLEKDPSHPDYFPALFLSCLSKLVKSYYFMKSTVMSNNSMSQSLEFSSKSDDHQCTKKQKLDIFTNYLYCSNYEEEFLFKLIESDDNSIKLIGLRLLPFSLFFKKALVFFDDRYISNGSNLSKGSLQSSEYDISESSLLNIAFYRKKSFGQADFLKLITPLLEEEGILCTYVIISCSSLFLALDEDINFIDKDLLTKSIQMLLPHIKRAKTSRFACTSLALLIQLLSDKVLNKVISKPIFNMIENIIDSSNIMGPYYISTESFNFWYTLNTILCSIGSSKALTVGVKAQEWLLSKWEVAEFYSSPRHTLIKPLAAFLCWLMSVIVNIAYFDSTLVDYRVNMNPFRFSKSEISKFMNSKLMGHSPSSKMYRVRRLHIESRKNINFLVHLIDVLKNSRFSDQNANFYWCILSFLVMSTVCEGDQYKKEFQHLYSLCKETMIRVDKKKDFLFGGNFLLLLGCCVNAISSNFMKEIVELLELEKHQYIIYIISRKVHKEDEINYEEEIDKWLPNEPIGLNKFSCSLSDPSLITLYYIKILIGSRIPLTKVVQFILQSSKNCKGADLMQIFYGMNYLFASVDNICNTFIEEDIDQAIRAIGEGPLSHYSSDRSGLVQKELCNFLTHTWSIYEKSKNDDFKKDYEDLCSWLFLCGERNMFVSHLPLSCYLRFLLELLICERETFLAFDLKTLFFHGFRDANNFTKVSVASKINSYMKSLDYNSQMIFYSELCNCFETTFVSTESRVTQVLVLSIVSINVPRILSSMVFNLLEFLKLGFSEGYAIECLNYISIECGFLSKMDLFEYLRLELFSYWFSFGFYLADFNFGVFEYKSEKTFLHSNSSELIASALAFKLNDSISEDVLSFISSVLIEDPVKLLVSSIHLTVALSFTKNGCRNEIFEYLRARLGHEYKKIMRDDLIFSITTIVGIMDSSGKALTSLTSDVSLLSLLDDFQELNEIPAYLSLSWKSANALINTLIGKFGGDYFWDVSIIYFIMRQILLSLDQLTDTISIIAVLKRLLFLLLKDHRTMSSFPIFRLLSFSLARYLLDSNLRKYVLCIFSTFLSNASFIVSDSSSVFMVVLYVFGIYFTKREQTEFIDQKILSVISKYLEHVNELEMSYILTALVVASKGRDFVRFSLVENAFIQICNTEFVSSPENRLLLMKIMSFLYPHRDKHEQLQVNSAIISILSEGDLYPKNDALDGFRLWASTNFAKFYLSGTHDTNFDSSRINKSSQSLVEGFERDSSSLYSLFGYFMRNFDSYNNKQAACIEHVMGVVIHIYKNEPNKVDNFLDCRKLYERYSSYLLPINASKLVEMNHDAYLTLSDGEIEDFFSFQELEAQPKNCTFETLIFKFTLFLIRHLSKVTSISSLIAVFLIRFPGISLQVIPKLLFFYLKMAGNHAAKNVKIFISKLFELESKNQKAKFLINEIVLGIRVGKFKNFKSSIAVYEEIDLKLFSSFALAIGEPFTALMILEEYFHNHPGLSLKDFAPFLSNCYTSLRDVDLIYGLPDDTSLENAFGNIIKTSSDVESLKILSARLDSNFSSSLKTELSNLSHSFVENGMLGVAKVMSKDQFTSANMDMYEWSWKLSTWDLPVSVSSKDKHALLYRTLKYSDKTSLTSLCENSMIDLMTSVDRLWGSSCLSNSSENTLLSSLACFYSLSELDSFLLSNYNEKIDDFHEITSWFEKSDISLSEDIILARKTAFEIFAKRKDVSDKHIYWMSAFNELARYNRIAQFAGDNQRMLSSANTMNEILIKSSPYMQTEIQERIGEVFKFHLANTLWLNNQADIGFKILSSMQSFSAVLLPIKDLNISPELFRSRLVDWASQSKRETPTNIMEKYILPIADNISLMKDNKQASLVSASFAKFCQNQFRARTLNDSIETLERRVSSKRREIEELKQHYGRVPVTSQEKKSAQKYYSKLKSRYSAESTDLGNLRESKKIFLSRAIQFYLRSVLLDENENESIDRFFALWLESAHKLHVDIEKDLFNLPTHCLVSWGSQLVSRISMDCSTFQKIIHSVIVNLTIDHPFHSIYNLISLQMHNEVAAKNADPVLISKVKACNSIWSNLLTVGDKRLMLLLSSANKFCSESIALAERKVVRGKDILLSSVRYGDYWVKHVPNIPPPSLAIKIDRTRSYQDVPVMIKVEDKVEIAKSGLSLPKIMRIQLSSGNIHKALFKYGADDLRQDLIMQQVFHKVNIMLTNDKQTSIRDLKIKTYKTVPLGPEGGIIEFVQDTLALIDIIGPYHKKHDSLSMDKAREMMKRSQTSSKHERMMVYTNITEKISPTLFRFFFENFLVPDDWYSSRMLYSKGIAVTSIVGYILGLGDRHCNNILINKMTGEPIHIDLGVAFDQGKFLPIPETVPFRLTRDIVSGFGITGVHGVFSKSCEHTYRVLRKNKEHILAILDVLRWDPLCSWTLSPLRRQKLQNDDNKSEVDSLVLQDTSEGSNNIALVAEKLVGEGLNEGALVRELISESTSEENLSVIYCGWCPFF